MDSLELLEWIEVASILLTLATLLILIWQTYSLRVTVETQNAYNRQESYQSIGMGIDEHVKVVDSFPGDYCDPEEWKKFSQERKREYVYFVEVMEYLIFCSKLRMYRGLKYRDWRDTLLWYKDIKEEPLFKQVLTLWKDYYPENLELLDRELVKLREKGQRTPPRAAG